MIIPKTMKRIPYGVSDYEKMVNENLYYVDKTRFIPVIEGAAWYAFLIRPRRFGKSLWVSVLENYYDINKKDRFSELFGHTWIGRNPTSEQGSHLILTFNFSLVNPDIRFVSESFEANGDTVIRDFLLRYERFFPEDARQAILSRPNTADKSRELFTQAGRLGLKIHLIIDEYDNFANTILTTAGTKAYHDLTHGAGFFRYFFNLLKGGTGRADAGLVRLFITGVSPVTMDDVTSGFNIGKQISLASYANELIGFTADEVKEMLVYYRDQGVLREDVDECFSLMSEWYDRYRFSEDSDADMFNSDMVLYFIDKAIEREKIPRDLIDQNIRIDYAKLRHLLLVDRQMRNPMENPTGKQLNGNFSELRRIMETDHAVSDIQAGFPLEALTRRENFISLLFYFGLLSIEKPMEGATLLRVPNQTVRKLMYGYLREAYDDTGVFRIDFHRLFELIRMMAWRGEWEAVFDFLAEQIAAQTSVRDWLEGEKVIQTFLLAYLNITDYFLTRPERELNKGYADLWLEPFLAVYPDMKYGYLVELKYLRRGEFTEELWKEKQAEAEAQLRRYSEDESIRRMAERVTIKRIVLIYNGWEMVARHEV